WGGWVGFEVVGGGCGGAWRGADRRFGSLPLGNVAVNHHNAAIRHRVVPHFNDRAIRARSLELIMFVEASLQAIDFGLGVGLAELAALREIANVFVEAMTLGAD